MKTAFFTLLTTVLISASSARLNATEVLSPMVGEWSSLSNRQVISQMNFFPNGLLTIGWSGKSMAARYKIIKTTVPRSDIYIVTGHIDMPNLGRFAHTQVTGKQSDTSRYKRADAPEVLEFTAKLTNYNKIMQLDVKGTNIFQSLELKKDRNIRTGVIPLQ